LAGKISPHLQIFMNEIKRRVSEKNVKLILKSTKNIGDIEEIMRTGINL